MDKCHCSKQGRKQLIDHDGCSKCASCGGLIRVYPPEVIELNAQNIKCIKSAENWWLPVAWCSASTNVKIYDD